MSRIRISHEELQSSFPKAVASIAKSVNKNRKSEGHPAIDASEMHWTCTFGPDYASNDPDPQLELLSIDAESGRFISGFTNRDKNTLPRFDELPPSLQQSLTLLVEGAQRDNLENCGVLTHVRKPYEDTKYLILDGFDVPNGDTRIALTKVGWPVHPSDDGSLKITRVWARVNENTVEIQHDVTDNDLYKLTRTEPGQNFNWGSKTARKMSPEELQMRFDGKTIDDSLESDLDRAARQGITPAGI